MKYDYDSNGYNVTTYGGILLLSIVRRLLGPFFFFFFFYSICESRGEERGILCVRVGVRRFS